MINRSDRRVSMPSFVPKFSDPDILKAIINSDYWRHLFLGERKAVWILFKALIFLKIEMFISPIKNLLRYDHGKRTFGVFILIMSTMMMITFNTQYVVGYLATFFPFIAPIIPFVVPFQDLLSGIFIEIKSRGLLYMWMAYLLISVFHLFRMYRGIGQTDSPSKRGNSVLYALIFRRIGINEKSYQIYLEPMMVGVIGYLFLSTGSDFTLGIFLLIGAFFLFIQEVYDAVMRFSVSQ